jgi:hypothetical protein
MQTPTPLTFKTPWGLAGGNNCFRGRRFQCANVIAVLCCHCCHNCVTLTFVKD